jgi:sulfoxide reductase heme-binding subunit YedZ
MTHFLGKAALNTLIITLSITPIVKKFKLGSLMQIRRILGLYTFLWASLHLLLFAWLELDWNFSLFFSEVVKRPYLTLGALAWLILLLLSVTSLTAIRKKMKKSWITLHRFVYVALSFIVIHYYWSVKSGVIEANIYIMITVFLLWLRKDAREGKQINPTQLVRDPHATKRLPK